MKKSIALSLAVVIAVGSVAATTTTASARYRHYDGYRHHRYYGGHYNNAAPFFFGSFLGGMLAQPYYGESYPYYSSPHVAWCLSHYRTYNPMTNTFFIRRGVPAICASPY